MTPREPARPRRCSVCDERLRADDLVVFRGDHAGHARCIEGASRPPAPRRPPRPQPSDDAPSA